MRNAENRLLSRSEALLSGSTTHLGSDDWPPSDWCHWRSRASTTGL